MPLWKSPQVDLILVLLGIFQIFAGDPLHRSKPRHVDLVVEVTDVGNDGVVLHLFHILDADDVTIACRGDKDVSFGNHVLQAYYLVAFHRCLQGTDRVYLGDNDPGTLTS